MRSIIMAAALVLGMSAPLMAQAQDSELDAALQAELDAALMGSAEEIEQQLEQLLADNPDEAAEILQQATLQAPAGTPVAEVVARVRTEQTTLQITNLAGVNSGNINNNNSNSLFAGANSGSPYGIIFDGELLALNVNSPPRFASLANGNLASVLMDVQAPIVNQWFLNNPNIQACIFGTSMTIGPYGTASVSVNRNC